MMILTHFMGSLYETHPRIWMELNLLVSAMTFITDEYL